MARLCDRCERGSNRANSRSHSNIATKREQFANLQARKIGGVKMTLCTRCLKTMRKTLAEKVAARAGAK
ncbi:MAG TPA: L28 family ribosomal protein [Candidatus Binatia bacterium]|jgi:ribosomal protein L28|nr:L28 family ribosomal protein [Candidatus Binatia bacterium]